jgi:hypothetical protein
MGRWAPQTALLSDPEQRSLNLMCQCLSRTMRLQRDRPLLALDREMADEEDPCGKDGTSTELCRMQPLVNGAQSRRYETVLDDLSARRG